MKTHLIGNAHLDPVWLWQWHEGYMEVKATFRSALDRMKEFPDFKFTSACAAYYEWVRDSDPDMFEEIRQRVEEGRWSITGGWYIQPDCNIPSGESFTRHALVSQRFFRDHLGKTAKIGYNVDSFGHNGSLPMILRQSGMEGYVFMRPGPHEKPDVPDSLFLWEGPDGTQIPTYRIPIRYNIDSGSFDCFARVKDMASEHAMMAFYGVGNHGGGATFELLDRMHRELDETCVYSTAEEYFDEVTPAHTVKGDLQFHAKGCYSACSMIKQNNRRSENALIAAEKYAVLSNKLMGTPYPSAELERGWKNTLFNQFHDILGGCSIREAYDDAAIQHGETQSIADRNTNFALQQISWNIDTIGDCDSRAAKRGWGAAWNAEGIGTPVVVFNPHPHASKLFVPIRDIPRRMTDSTGAPVKIQKIRASKTNGRDDKWETGFIAELPALGYHVYRMYFEGDAEEYDNPFTCTETSIENECVRLDFAPETGELTGITDKSTGRQLMSAPSRTILMDETDSDTWSHGITEFRKLAETFTEGSCRLLETGPLRAAMRCVTKGENSTVIRDYRITAGSAKITVNCRIDFHEKHRMLKFALPVNVGNAACACEIPFGKIARPTDGSEQTCQSWVTLTDENGGLAVVNDSKYSFSAEGNELRLTVLRGAIFADHYGTRDDMCIYMDQGIHEFTYGIMPYAGDTETVRFAQEINTKPFVVMETFHRGKLAQEYGGLSVSADNVIVTAVKKHEDSDAVVLRAYECEGRATDAKLNVFGREFDASFAPRQVKTFLIDEGGVKECDFLE
ncbi:MAG: alpha-mannosidase [Clostridia bacterium]|nr:alpha-mannosidase [Clostridia bacterium]